MNVSATLKHLTRPSLLVKSARIGLVDYHRDSHLKRLIECVHPPSPQAAAEELIELEQDHETRRRTADASYSLTKHVDVLIALMAEARLLAGPHSL